MRNEALWLWLLTILSVVFLCLYSFFVILASLQHGYNVDTYAANGTFQLYNPLRRLAEGEIAGYDFPFFHGVGVILLHFPVFFVLGEHLFAAETAKYLVSPILFLLSSFTFFYAYFRKFQKAIISTAIFTIVASLCIDVIWPENSLVGARSTLPVLVAAAMIWKTTRVVKIKSYTVSYNDIAAVILLGVSVACGTEQGVAAIMAFLLLRAFTTYKQSKLRPITFIKLGIVIISLSLSVLFVMSILTLGHAFNALHYALVDIPNDQSWYFGTPPNGYLTWGNLLPELLNWRLRYIYLLAMTAIMLAVIAIKTKIISISNNDKNTFLFMALTGIIVFVAGAVGGYYAPSGQLIPLHRMVGLISIALFVNIIFNSSLWGEIPQHISSLSQRIRIFAKLILPYLVVILMIIALSYYTKQYLSIVRSFPVKSILGNIKQARHLSDYDSSSSDWKTRIDTFQPYIKQDSTIWSTYTSLYNDGLNNVNPSTGGEDYIIHALGQQRRDSYQKQFAADRPEYTITLKPTYFPYEEWLWSRDWQFYYQLLINYDIVAENSSHFLWKLRASPSYTQKPWQMLKEGGSNEYVLPLAATDSIKVYEVSVDYKAQSGTPLSLLNKIPKYLINIINTSSLQYPISLPPNETTWSFPIVVMPGESRITLQKKVDGIIPSASLSITKVQYRELNIPLENKFLFLNNYCSIDRRYLHDSQCSASNLPFKKWLATF